MTRLGLYAIVCVCMASASLARAQAPKPTIDLSTNLQQRFTQADLDHSGTLSKNEAATAGFAVEEKFDSVDADHDGVVTLFEIGSYLVGQKGTWDSADTNHDGVVSREEAERSPSLAKIFTKADRDGDGVIRKEEYEAFSETTLYQNVDLPYVVPNIINKKF